jgi:hypothetical protein
MRACVAARSQENFNRSYREGWTSLMGGETRVALGRGAHDAGAGVARDRVEPVLNVLRRSFAEVGAYRRRPRRRSLQGLSRAAAQLSGFEVATRSGFVLRFDIGGLLPCDIIPQ